MNRTMMMLCIGVVALWKIKLVCCKDIKGDKAYRDPSLSGLIFTENLLYERNVKSKIGCASLCLKTDQCVTFTLTPVTSGDDVCRAHSATMSVNKAHNVSGNTSLYRFQEEAEEDWLGAACTDDQDCSQPNTICFKGLRCMCEPGFYYSVSCKSCQASCSPGDLQDTYLEYAGGVTLDVIPEQNKTVNASVTENWCQLQCSGNSDCLYFEYFAVYTYCILETYNPRGMPARIYWLDDPRYMYYQKNCA